MSTRLPRPILSAKFRTRPSRRAAPIRRRFLPGHARSSERLLARLRGRRTRSRSRSLPHARARRARSRSRPTFAGTCASEASVIGGRVAPSIGAVGIELADGLAQAGGRDLERDAVQRRILDRGRAAGRRSWRGRGGRARRRGPSRRARPAPRSSAPDLVDRAVRPDARLLVDRQRRRSSAPSRGGSPTGTAPAARRARPAALADVVDLEPELDRHALPLRLERPRRRTASRS